MDSSNQYGIKDVQLELLEIIKEFDRMCIAEGIHYSVSSGTLLGAVRHQGFIPWDDDLDVVVGRDDFEKLSRIVEKYPQLTMKKFLWLDRVHLTTTVLNKDTNIPALDIFIWDNTPDNFVKAKMKYFLIAFLQGMMKDKPTYSRFSFKEKVFAFVSHIVGKLFMKDTILRFYSHASQWGNKKPTRYMGSWHDQFHGLGYKYDSKILSSVERRQFEDIKVNAFVKYDKYLRIIYGDNYMIPPEEEKRFPHNLSYLN